MHDRVAEREPHMWLIAFLRATAYPGGDIHIYALSIKVSGAGQILLLLLLQYILIIPQALNMFILFTNIWS